MKTREQIYGQEAAGILRDVSMYLRLALGWQEVSMTLVTRAGTVSSFSSTMDAPSLGWIPPQTNKSSTFTQEQVVKICSFYCAFWKGERHEVN